MTGGRGQPCHRQVCPPSKGERRSGMETIGYSRRRSKYHGHRNRRDRQIDEVRPAWESGRRTPSRRIGQGGVDGVIENQPC